MVQYSFDYTGCINLRSNIVYQWFYDSKSQDNLIEIVENDVDEIEYFPSIQDKENDYDLDVYLSFRNGYLEIDDDFLGKVNEVSVAVYQENGSLLYGENPLSQELSDIYT